MPQSRPLGINDREHPRAKASGKGVIVFDEGRFVIPCAIIDLSQSGAQLQVPFGVAMPEVFQLLIGGQRLAAECAVAWRKPLACGVRLIVRYNLSALPPGREYLAQVWRDRFGRAA